MLVSVVCNVQQHNYLHASNILSLSISTLQPETVFVVLSAKGSCDTVSRGFMPLFDLSNGRLSYLWVINTLWIWKKKSRRVYWGVTYQMLYQWEFHLNALGTIHKVRQHFLRGEGVAIWWRLMTWGGWRYQ